jgi:hypothetical protein
LLHPRTNASTTYDISQMALLWYIVATVPWRIAFNIQPTMVSHPVAFWFDLFVDLAIVFDICLNFRRFYVDSRSHKLVTDPDAIRRTYMKSWFLIDFVSVIPFDRIVALIGSGDPQGARSSKMIRLARLARFARLARLTKLASLRKFTKMVNETLREIGVGKPGMEFVGRIMFLAGVVLFVTHVVGCLWINSGRAYTERCTMIGSPNYHDVPQDWIDCKRDPATPEIPWVAGAGLNNWYANEYWPGAVDITAEEFQAWDLGPGNTNTVYLDACYWVLVTMSTVGYGDVSSSTATSHSATPDEI